MDNFNDGIIYFYKRKTIVNSFKASKNVLNDDDLEFINNFYFKEETQRQQDVVFANSMDKKLSMKISIPYVNTLKSDYIVIIENYIYSIFHIDSDKSKHKTYIYLEGMRKNER